MTRHTPFSLAAVAILLAACSADADPNDRSGEEPPTASPSGDLVQATRLTEAATSDSELVPGVYAMGFSSDQADVPMVLIDVPAGYYGRGDGFEITAEEGGFRHFDTWTVSEVAEEPCGGATWVDPGPGVADLGDALAALPVWETSKPVPVTIGGYSGVVMDFNVPARLPARCHGDLFGWREYSGGTQGIGPGKAQRLWIVDVDGHRLMLVVGYFPGPDGPTRAVIKEMNQMAEGAAFVEADHVAP